jgi:hypothetical protein
MGDPTPAGWGILQPQKGDLTTAGFGVYTRRMVIFKQQDGDKKNTSRMRIFNSTMRIWGVLQS